MIKRIFLAFILTGLISYAFAFTHGGFGTSSGSDLMQAKWNATLPGAWFDTGVNLASIAYTGPATYGSLNCSSGPPYSGSNPPSIQGTNGNAAIMYAWNTPTLDTDNERLLFIDEGGHNDYRGNEGYAITFATLAATMLRCPDSIGTQSAGNTLTTTGNPSSRHVYGGEVYKPLNGAGSNAGDVFMINGAPMSITGGGSNGAFSYKVSTNIYTQVGNPTNSSDGTQGGGVYCGFGANAGTIYFGASGNDFEKFDGQNFTQLNSTGYTSGHEESPSIDRSCNVYWLGNSTLEKFTAAGTGPTVLTTSGAAPPCYSDVFPGQDFDADDGHILLYCGGTTIYKFDITHAGTGGDPVPITSIVQVGSVAGPQCTDSTCGTQSSGSKTLANGMWKHAVYDSHYHMLCVIMGINDNLQCRKRNSATD